MYIVVIFGMRIMGKRQLGQLQPSELVITILISNIATLPIENSDVPLILGIIPILTLMCFEVILSVLTLKSIRFRRLIWGNTKILIQDGKIKQQELADLRYSVDDLMEQLRTNGIFDLREVEFALTETTGQLSICKKTSYETLNPKTAGIKVTETPPPSIVISDRKVLSEGMKNCMLSQKELDRILKKEGYKPEEVFLMTCTPQKDYYIVPLEKKH
ncbi:DUF421 domain-containing protein [Negativibacillus massiliensis]|uniref:DUF421 domain-containing protein n=1 Tax=Negativibacillus massiliensis TaxID=1871035 RepID=UPI003AF22AA9